MLTQIHYICGLFHVTSAATIGKVLHYYSTEIPTVPSPVAQD